MDVLNILAVSTNALASALLLATINSWLVDFLAAPIKVKFPDVSLWWLPYVALLTGFLAAWFGNINLLEGMVESVILGKLVTGIAIGGGAKQIHEWFDPSTENRVI